MAIRRPTLSQFREISEKLAFQLSDQQLSDHLDFLSGSFDAYDQVALLPDYLPAVKYPRGTGYRPDLSDNPYNAWYVKTEITGAASGLLKGKSVAVKDNIAVAGVQMMNGSAILEGYVPDVDATVVTRVLDAGATITGKSQCEYYCLSGGSHTGAQGPVENPHRAGHSAAGSSSGSAALLAAGLVDLAIGGDQGGSVRTPSSYCGTVGLKPTWGLVPYTGAMPIEMTLDHLGPMSRTVADNALLLEVLAGADGLDPRQSALAKPAPYRQALTGDARGLRIGVVREGFGHSISEADVDEAVRKAAKKFAALGATVEEISIPWHRIGPSIWLVIATEGATHQMMMSNSHGYNWKGLYVTSMIKAHSSWHEQADQLPDTLKSAMLLGDYMTTTGRGAYYAKAQNLSRRLRAEYDRALSEYDILVMPTTPIKAPPLPPPGAALDLYLRLTTENMVNTFPFDVTGHPALSMPCGMSNGLPIGMMLIGRHFDEMSIYRAAYGLEQSFDWRHA